MKQSANVNPFGLLAKAGFKAFKDACFVACHCLEIGGGEKLYFRNSGNLDRHVAEKAIENFERYPVIVFVLHSEAMYLLEEDKASNPLKLLVQRADLGDLAITTKYMTWDRNTPGSKPEFFETNVHVAKDQRVDLRQVPLRMKQGYYYCIELNDKPSKNNKANENVELSRRIIYLCRTDEQLDQIIFTA